jgi:hypothetical protein
VSKPGSYLLWRAALASRRVTKKEEGKGQKTQKRKKMENAKQKGQVLECLAYLVDW